MQATKIFSYHARFVLIGTSGIPSIFCLAIVPEHNEKIIPYLVCRLSIIGGVADMVIRKWFPYTPSTQKVSSFEDAYKQNTADGPNSSIMNFRSIKIFLVAKLSMTLTLDVLNVLNENVTSLSDGFNVNYGRPYQYGVLITKRGRFINGIKCPANCRHTFMEIRDKFY